MNLNDLKEALDKGEIFSGTDKLNKLTKAADGIGDLSGKERHDVFKKRDDRVDESWENATEEDMKKMVADDSDRMEKRNEANKNEMELAKIQFIENEINVLNEYISNLVDEVNDKKREIDNHQIKIDEIKKKIE